MREFWKTICNTVLPRGLTQWFTILCAVITLLGIPYAFLKDINKANINAQIDVMAYFICAFLSLLIIVLVFEEFRWHRKARYAEAQSRLHDAYHSIRDAWHVHFTNQSHSQIEDLITDALGHYANAFSLITGVCCRVCIKELICFDPKAAQPEHRYVVKTLLRSATANGEVEPSPNDTKDCISNNSDFLYLYRNPNEKRFIVDNILNENGYQNSHSHPPGNLSSLPYRSVCVWPIKKRFGVISNKKKDREDDLIAFLCVDSMARGAFNDRYDVNLGAAFADTLYPIIKQIKQS